MNRQRPAGFALVLLGTLLCLGGASPRAHAASLTTLHAFNPLYPPYNDGAKPSGLILASDGNFYGVTAQGGLYNDGTFYRMTPAGAVTILYSFSALIQQSTNSDGAYPLGLTQGSDGNFYGATAYGGAYGDGTIYKITPAGVLTTLHSFNPNTEEGNPSRALTQGSDGNFYGTTDGIIVGMYGTIFKITPTGVYTTLHIFQNIADGAHPSPLTLGPDGNLYGTAEQGGTWNYGSVFRITPDGTYTTLHAFTQLSPYPNYTNYDGAAPNTGLVLGKDGNFYGSTLAGGAYNQGTIFRITTGGTLTTLSNTGATALTLGRDGHIYGAAGYGGPMRSITIFKLTPFSTLLPIARISSGDPQLVINNLTQGTNGQFYFTSSSLGNNGEIDRLNYSPFDITGNGQPDLLFQNPTTGQLSVTSMTGPTASSPTAIGNTVPAGWKAVGIGDFNLDAQPDLLLQNPTTGQLAVWYMNGAAATGGAYISPRQAPGWQVVSVVDVNADGNPDILFQNSSTGQLAVWYMNGTVATQASYITPNPPSGWKAIGTGDFNGDGNLELLLQNPTTGQMALWFLSGTAARSAAYITPSQNPAWQAVSIVDLNGDGKADIVFQNSSTGQLAVWYMNGTSASGAAYITSSQSSGGQVVGPR